MEYIALFLFLTGILLITLGFFLSPKNFLKKTPHTPTPIGFRVQTENPRLFSTKGFLYYDQSGESSYFSSPEDFETNRLSQIRRVGHGKLSFDGVSFCFEDERTKQNFPLNALEQILFYPNCVVFIPKEKAPIPLIFLDETESLRQLLETFRQDHVT